MTFLRKHPALSYFALVFTISWGGVLFVVGPGGIPGTKEQFDRLLPIAILAMVAGPSVAGLLLTALIGGTAGLREFGSRLLKWRVHARWYAIALLTAPVLMVVLLLALSLFSREFLPGVFVADDKVRFVLSGLAIGLVAGFVEELGWTGFATPALRRRHGVLTTGITVGLLWALWHVLVGYWASGTVSGPLALASFLLDPFLFLAPFRVLMVWVYEQTGSLLVGMLMHVSLTASARIFGAPAIAGVPLLISDVVWAAAVSVVIVIAFARDSRS